jgi:hypothetical protein
VKRSSDHENSIIGKVHSIIKDRPEKDHQLYTLMFSILLSVLLWLDVQLVADISLSIEETVIYAEVTVFDVIIACFQGLVMGYFVHFTYESGVSYAKIGCSSRFQSKEIEYSYSLGLVTVVGIIVGIIIPVAAATLPVPLVQMVGVVMVLGPALTHARVETWKLKNEWPLTLSGTVLFFAPFW